MKKLPIGISEFEELREKECLYVDKTRYVYQLLKEDVRTFLSRPRRFGKSLFVSTLESALRGKKELFKGLWIEKSDYEWPVYGVIRLDFSALDSKSPQALEQSLIASLVKIAKREGIKMKDRFIGVKDALDTVVEAFYDQFGRVALLIDEYDSPVLHALHTPSLAVSIREIIKDFSTGAKAQQKKIKMVFVTGVSAFSKAGLSSGLNNLKNLTMLEEFSSICGYTDLEVEEYFSKFIRKWSLLQGKPYEEVRQTLKQWYNGYCFKENTETVYSPFSFISSIDIQELGNFWFESATPQFLLEEVQKLERREECRFLAQENFVGSMDTLQTFEIEHIPLMALLFQMGYLTLDTYDVDAKIYRLKYPNLEVMTAFHKHLFIAFTKMVEMSLDALIIRLFAALKGEDIPALVSCLETVFSNIPYQIREESEKYYHSIVQALFVAAGLCSQAEYSTALGRADLVIELPSVLYVLEIKVQGSAKRALEQIEQKRYARSFDHKQKNIHLVGLSFSRKRGGGLPLLTYATKKLKVVKHPIR